MADAKVRIRLEGKDNASDDVNKVNKSLKGMDKSAMKSVLTFAKITAAVIAVKKAFDFAMEATMAAAQVDQVTRALDSMAAQAGTSAKEIVQTMQEMSGGTIDQLNILQSASKAALLGIPIEQLDELMQVARASATALGTDVGQMFDDLATGIGRQSKMILDNLGINVSAMQAHKKYAESIGKTSKQLTEAEKKQAFLNAVLEDGQRIMKMVGAAGAEMTATEPFQMMGASAKDLVASIGSLLLPSMNLMFLKAQDILNTFTAWTRSIRDSIDQFNRLKAARAFEEISRSLNSLTTQFDVLTTDIGSFDAAFKDMTIDMLRSGAPLQDILKGQHAAYTGIADKIREVVEAQETLRDVELGRILVSTQKLRELQGLTRGVTEDQMRSLTMFLQMYDAQIKSLDNQIIKIKELTADQKLYAGVLDELKKTFAAIDEQAIIFGESFDANKTKAQALQSAIHKLTEEGFTAQGGALTNLLSLYGKYLKYLEETAKKTKDTITALDVAGVGEILKEANRQMRLLRDESKKLIADIEKAIGIENRRTQRLKERADIQDKFSNALMTDFEMELSYIDELHAEYLAAGVDQLQLQGWYTDAVDAAYDTELQRLALEKERTAELAAQLAIEERRQSMGAFIGVAESFAGTEMGGKMAAGLGMADPMTAAIKGMADMVTQIKAVNAVLNPLTTIFEVMLGILTPIINEILAPIVGVLVVIGQVLADAIKPVLIALGPILELIAQIFYVALRPALNIVAPMLMIVAQALEFLIPIIEIVAKALDIMSRPVEVIGNLFMWVVNTIRTAIHNLVEFIKHPFSKKRRDLWAYPSFAAIWEPLTRPLIDFTEMLTNTGMQYLSDVGADLGEGTTIYGGETTVQRVPDIYIYQTFQGPIIGAGGMQEFGEFTADALEEYAGIGGIIHIEEAIAPQTE